MAYNNLIKDVLGDNAECKLKESDFVKYVAYVLDNKSLFHERNINILFRRYGLNGYSEHTLRAAAEYSLTSERVRQIIAKQIRMLGNGIRKRWLTSGRDFSETIKELEEFRKLHQI